MALNAGCVATQGGKKRPNKQPGKVSTPQGHNHKQQEDSSSNLTFIVILGKFPAKPKLQIQGKNGLQNAVLAAWLNSNPPPTHPSKYTQTRSLTYIPPFCAHGWAVEKHHEHKGHLISHRSTS